MLLRSPLMVAMDYKAERELGWWFLILSYNVCITVVVVVFWWCSSLGGEDVVLFNGGQRKCHESVFEVRVLKEGDLRRGIV